MGHTGPPGRTVPLSALCMPIIRRDAHNTRTKARVARTGHSGKLISRLDSAADHQVVVLAGEDRIKSALIKEDGKHMLKRIPQGYGWSGDENCR